MKKFNFGKVFGLMAAAVAVFAVAGCEQVNDMLKRSLDKLPTTVEDKAGLEAAFGDESVTEIKIEDDIDGSESELTVKGDKTIYIPGGKETSIGTLALAAGSHVKIMNADDVDEPAGSGQSVRAALSVMNEADYTSWATLVIWNHFNIPNGATFDLIGRVRLIFRQGATVENNGTFSAKEDNAVLLEDGDDKGAELGAGLGLGADVPTIVYEPKTPAETTPPVGNQPIDTRIHFAIKDYTIYVDQDLDNLSDTAWTLNADEANTVYFAVEKSAACEIEVGGEDAAKVTQADVDTTVAEAMSGGLTATDELAVFTVDTRDLVFEGGERTFTLGDVAVTLNVLPNTTGAAVYTVTWPEGQDYYTNKNYDGTTLTRVWEAKENEGALQAIEYVDCNAEADTEYLIRVEKDEKLPRIYISCKKQENVTMRLRGMGQARTLSFRTAYHGDNTVDSYNREIFTGNDAPKAPSSIGNRSDGFFNIGGGHGNYTILKNKITFILDNNITVKGSGESLPEMYFNLFLVGSNGTLVLRKGALITEGNTDVKEIIKVLTQTAVNGTPLEIDSGKVRIEGGSITSCTFSSPNRLIWFNAKEARWWPGSFYMAPSTEDNPIVLSGNFDNHLFFYVKDATPYNLSDYLGTGLSVPAQ